MLLAVTRAELRLEPDQLRRASLAPRYLAGGHWLIDLPRRRMHVHHLPVVRPEIRWSPRAVRAHNRVLHTSFAYLTRSAEPISNIMPTRRTAHPKQPMSAERRDTSSTPTDPMLVDTTVSSTAARPGSSSMPLRPGDALTVWRGEKCSRATFFASSTTQLQVIWSGGELEGSCEALPRTEIKWLAGWHESANFAQASNTNAFTTSIDHLMHCCTINTVR